MIAGLLLFAVSRSAAIDERLFDDLEHRAVNFFWERSNPENGFTRDRSINSDQPGDPGVASCAAVGFALVAYPIGVQRKWLERTQALERTRITLRHLNTDWPSSHGFLYHFVDPKTAAREWNCEVSSIDTSICLAGVMDAEQYWHDPQVTQEAKRFEKRIDWKWMLTDGDTKPNAIHFSMGWSPEHGFIPSRWDHFDENKLLYIQAYGLSDVTTAGWDKIQRPIVQYKGLNLITGGPLFMHEMSESFYDFKGRRDRLGFNYAVESRNAALANRLYCIDNPKKMNAYGPDFWGLSACDTPTGYSANGAPGWIQDDGTITPTSAVAAVQWLPKEAASFAEAMRRDHPDAWGRYGFPNGYNPEKNWTDKEVIGIDLGMMLLAIENTRSGLPISLSMSHPAVILGFDRAGLRRVPDADKGPLQTSPKP